MEEKVYEENSLGWFREQAKKDGFDSITVWNNLRRKKLKEKSSKQYTDNQLLWYLIKFYVKYGRPPGIMDFRNNPDYPSPETYIKRFKSWSNALKLVELDVESMVRKGIIETIDQKRRFSEMIVRDHFKEKPVDLAGENCHSHCDGICPNGKYYDVKSSGLHNDTQYIFGTNNKYKEKIEIYYLLAFNEDYTKLNYGWRIPGEIVEKDRFLVGLGYRAKYNIGNMKQYDITDKLNTVLREYEFL